ncbi:MAG: DegV family protein [Vulcanimicrobiaceae bacterium]
MAAIVTDSTADLDPEVAKGLGIDVVPLYVNFGSESFLDRVEITREAFYQRLAAGGVLPTTTQASTAAYEQSFATHVSAGEEIVCLSISGRLSGTINAASAAAAHFPDATICVFDSRTVSGGLGLLVFAAHELTRRGASAVEIVAALEGMRARQALYAAIPDLSHAVRTGRISRTMATIGGMMRILPVLGLDDEGKVAEIARVRTFDRALDTLVEETATRLARTSDSRVAIVHAHAPQTAETLRERLVRKTGGTIARLDVLETGPAIAVHAGIGAAGIFSLF